ncbi:MAG: nitroreductase [Proteobacteria bacterium]|nr:nitroreductase [Pseudomonadota bacterium]
MSDQTSSLANIILSRRTIHNFKNDSIPDKKIILDAIGQACWAPNHHLTEPWHFYLLEKETITSICELNRDMLLQTKGVDAAEKKYQRWMSIPGWLVITCQMSEDEIRYQEDYAACCCAIQNLMLLLWEQGIGTKWSTGPVVRDDQFYDLVWVNKEIEHVVGIIWYGYPAEIPQTIRKSVNQITTELP